MRFLENRFADDDSKAARAFVQAMLDEERTVIVPAPSLAEHLRGGGTDLPSTRLMYVVPFDRKAATQLAAVLPLASLQSAKVESGRSYPAIKFDALIVACALRWDAEVLVSIDAGLRKMGARAGMRCEHPEDFYADQVEFNHEK